MTPDRTVTWYLWIAVIGVVVTTTCVVLIILEPAMLGSYFTAAGGLCSTFVSVAAIRAIKKAQQVQNDQPVPPAEENGDK